MAALAAPERLLGCEAPRLFTPPLRELTPETTAGFNFIDFAEGVLGLTLLPYQKWLALHALELRPDGRFRFRTVLVLIARQNGKSTFLQAMTLWRMWVDRIPLALVAAQSLEKAEEVWAGAVEMAEGTPELAAEVDKVDLAAGKKTLKTTFGSRLKVQTANRKGGRSLSADLVDLDELREHQTWDAWAALTKTTQARPNAQVWATSNAGDDLSVVLNDLRAKALDRMDDPATTVGIFEWSAPDGCDLADRDGWAMANPALGYTIEADTIAAALDTDPPHVFRTETLCQRVQLGADSPLPAWPTCARDGVSIDPAWPVAFAVDVSWDRSTAWISAAARRPDGTIHVEAAAQGQGTEWVGPWLAEKAPSWEPVAVTLQANGAPVSSLLEPLTTSLGSALVRGVSGVDMARAAGELFDLVTAGGLVHPGQTALNDAAAVAAVRPIGDAWTFDRKRSPRDIAPLVAASLAAWTIARWQEPPKRRAPRRLR